MHAEGLNDEARRQAVIWASRHRVLSRLFSAAFDAGIDLLVFKGVHLAYNVYPDVCARDCADTDLLVRPQHRSRFLELLASNGFVPGATNTGDVALGQVTWEQPSVPGSVLDVHSRFVTPHDVAKHFGFVELWSRSVPFAAFPANVRVPSHLDALEIALVHQAVHHPGATVPMWSHDVHLLMQALNAAEAGRFCARVDDDTLRPEWLYPLLEAQREFPSDAGAVLAGHVQKKHGAIATSSVSAGERLRRAASDLRTLSPSHAARVLSAHLFPPAAYMRETYAPRSRWPLPVLYAVRLFRGLRKISARPTAASAR